MGKWNVYGSGWDGLLLDVDDSDAPDWVLYFRGRGLFETARFGEAAECFRDADRRDYHNGKKALYLEALGNSLAELGQIDEALQCFASGIHQSSERGGCHRSLAVALLQDHAQFRLPDVPYFLMKRATGSRPRGVTWSCKR